MKKITHEHRSNGFSLYRQRGSGAHCAQSELDAMPGSALPRSEWHIDHRRRLCQPVWNESEITAIEKLAEMKDMDTAAVIRQALRQYHAVAHGACSITWPND